MKKEKTKEVAELVEPFCKRYFTEELTTCALRLCDKLGRIRKLDIPMCQDSFRLKNTD